MAWAVDRTEAINAVLARAEQARLKQSELADRAGVHRTTMTRAKKTGRIDIDTLDKLEKALTAVEAERAAA